MTAWIRTEDDVSTIEPRGYNGGNEELRAVGVLSSVSHGQKTGLGVLELEVLVCGLHRSDTVKREYRM